MKTNKHLTVLSLILLLGTGIQAAAETAQKTILTNCSIVDVIGRSVMDDMTVIITGNTITEIKQETYSASAEANDIRVFDLEGGYVIPGLWNMHVHLSDLLPDVHDMLGSEPVLPAAIRAGRNAMDALRRGFTGLRIVGERDYIDIAWRDAFDAGVFAGPRIFASGKVVTPSESSPWESRWPVEIFADGPYEIRKEMRKNMAYGIDFVKIFATHMQKDEFTAAIETAHNWGYKVTAHAGGENARRAVEAGVDCIEHGTMISDETIQLMAEKGVFYCPTIVCNLSEQYIKEREERLARLGYAEDKEVVQGRKLVAYADVRSQRVAERQRKILLQAADAGIKIISGSDSNPLGELGILEIEQLVLSGLKEMQALQAATINCAEICGVSDKLGSIETGKWADMIVVKDNPLENISNLRKLQMVVKDGHMVNLNEEEGRASFWNLYFK